MRRTATIVAVAVFVSGLSVQARAENILTPSTTDLWDISQGATVTGNSPVMQGTAPYHSDIRDMFGANYSVLPAGTGVTLFADRLPAGTVHWVEWQTSQPVTIRSFALFAHHDGTGYDANQRGFSRFSLYCYDTASAQFQDVYDLFPSNPYGSTPAPANTFIDTTYPSEYLALRANITPTTTQSFRAEFVQFGDIIPGASGPRVNELDGFETTFTPIPEPSTFALLSVGAISLLFYAWRRRKRAA